MNIQNQYPCNPSNYGGYRNNVEYIVIHYTGNKTDLAINNARYFHNNQDLNASAHYFVDSTSIYQSVEENRVAWSVGVKYKDAPYWNRCKNSNSISIEMCSQDGAFTQETINNAIALTKDIMARYNIPMANVLRHYDVCGKSCPAWEGWLGEDAIAWFFFKMALTDNNPCQVIESIDTQAEISAGNIDWDALQKINIAKGQLCINDYLGINIGVDGIVGSETRKAKVKVLQYSLNKDYGSNLCVDGILGTKTTSALARHYVKKGEVQWMVTCAEIFAYLEGLNPNGVEYPGIFGNGLADALGDYIGAEKFLDLANN